jgi:hypothetical protein
VEPPPQRSACILAGEPFCDVAVSFQLTVERRFSVET